MATTVADINCVESRAVQLYDKKVQELTCVVTRYLPYFYRTALRRMRNVADAEDVVQDALLSAYSHVEQFRGQARMSTWLTSIVINSAGMRLRWRSRQASVPLDEQESDAYTFAETLSDSRPNPEEECRRTERAELLAHSFRMLSPTLRHTFQLRDVNGLSIRETAHLLGIPEGTVKARVARARAKLKQLVQKGLGRNIMIDLKTRLSRVSWLQHDLYSRVCLCSGRIAGDPKRQSLCRNACRHQNCDSDSSSQVREPAVRPVNPVREGHVKQ